MSMSTRWQPRGSHVCHDRSCCDVLHESGSGSARRCRRGRRAGGASAPSPSPCRARRRSPRPGRPRGPAPMTSCSATMSASIARSTSTMRCRHGPAVQAAAPVDVVGGDPDVRVRRRSLGTSVEIECAKGVSSSVPPAACFNAVPRTRFEQRVAPCRQFSRRRSRVPPGRRRRILARSEARTFERFEQRSWRETTTRP